MKRLMSTNSKKLPQVRFCRSCRVRRCATAALLSSGLYAVLLTGGLAGCDKPKPSAEPPRPVRTVTIGNPSPVGHETLTGVLAPHTKALLGFSILGTIAERTASVGDTVTKGTVVARMDDAVQEKAVRVAKAELETARVELKRAEQNHDRVSRLARSKAVSVDQLEEAQRTLAYACSQVGVAEAAVERAQAEQDLTVLRAPGDGVILERIAEKGESPVPGQHVYRMALCPRFPSFACRTAGTPFGRLTRKAMPFVRFPFAWSARFEMRCWCPKGSAPA